MKKSILCHLIFLNFIIPTLVVGQTSIVLDEYVEQALSNNLGLKSLQFSKDIQGSKIDQAKKLWDPSVDLATSYLFAQGGRTITFPVGDLFNPAYGAINRLSGSDDFPTNLENFETQLTPNNFLDANLSITKPLINSAISYNIKIQQALVGLVDMDAQIQRQEIIYQVKQAYFNLLKTVLAKSILEENLSLLEDVKEFNQKLIKYDKATPDVISDVVYQMVNLENQMISLNQQNEISKILFNTLLNRDINESIILDTTFFEMNHVELSDLERLVQTAYEERQEFKKLELSKSINDLNVQRIESGKKPTVGIQGAMGIQSEGFSFDDGGPLFTAAVSLGWNIWDSGRRKKQIEELMIKNLQIENDQLYTKQQIRLQVAQVYYNIQSLLSNLQTKEAAIAAAETSYKAILKRYENEKALLIELLSAQNKLTSSKLQKVLVTVDLLIEKANLERITISQ